MLADTVQRQSENIETKTITESLPCTLTREESHRYGKEVSKLVSERDSLESSKKSVANSYKKEIDKINLKVSDLSEKVNANQEFRDIECHQEFDYIKAMVRTIRLDTGEEVDYRRMTAKEMQRPLFGGDIE